MSRRSIRGEYEIFVKTLTLADTWYAVATDICANHDVYKWEVKVREITPNDIDFSFKDSPTKYKTTSTGYGDDTSINNLYARSTVAGTIVELIVYYEK